MQPLDRNHQNLFTAALAVLIVFGVSGTPLTTALFTYNMLVALTVGAVIGLIKASKFKITKS